MKDDKTTDIEHDDGCEAKTPHERRLKADAILADHDGYWKARRGGLAAVAAAAETRWWQWVRGAEKGEVTEAYLQVTNEYEVNRIKPAASTYLAQLFPRALRVDVADTASTTGDRAKAELAINDWMFNLEQRARWDRAIRQSIYYPGVGLKLAVDHFSARPADDRVEMQVFPIWEAVVDREVYDERHQRFRGHAGWRPIEDVAEEFDIPRDKLKGFKRKDWLDDTASSAINAAPNQADTSKASTQGDQWVRVLELCNFVDDFVDDDGTTYKGALEIYVMDQGELSKEPVYVGALPLLDPDGEPAPHIFIHMFETRAEYPLQGVAPAAQWMPQQREINAYRSQQADKASRDKTVFLAPEFVDSDTRRKHAQAGEMEIVYVPRKIWEEVGGNLSRLFVPVQAAPQSVDVGSFARQADQDLTSTIALSPSALGVRQNVTAEEIQYQRDFTDSEFGRYAAAWERTLEVIGGAYLMALVSALRPPPASDEEVSDEAREEDTAEIEPVKPDYSTEVEPDDGDDILHEAADASENPERKPLPKATKTRQKLVLKDAQDNNVEITEADIDSWFRFSFADAGRTPGARLEIRSNLMQIMGPYNELWKVVVEDGPTAGLALEEMKAIFTNFLLPANLDPERLLADLEEKKKAKAGGKQPDVMQEAAQPPGAPPPQPGAPPAPGGPPPQGAAEPAVQVEQVLAAIEQQFGTDPQIKAEVDRIRALPPEQQLDATKTLIQALQGGAQGQPAPGVA